MTKLSLKLEAILRLSGEVCECVWSMFGILFTIDYGVWPGTIRKRRPSIVRDLKMRRSQLQMKPIKFLFYLTTVRALTRIRLANQTEIKFV